MGDPNFLASMTFASGDIGCDCDECENGESAVPHDIQRAVQEHLKKRKLEQPIFQPSQHLNIQQQRQMVKRECGVSVWKLTLPQYHGRGADPIVEYRNSHRILFVDKMPKGSSIQSVGKGIIGSAAEEKSRKSADWNQGESYFLPCIGGIACGWVNTTKTDEESMRDSSDDDDSTVIIYTLKVSPTDLDRLLNGGDTQQLPYWVAKAVEMFAILTNDTASDEMLLSQEHTALMREIIDLVLA